MVEKLTKRKILSETAKLFDPLDLLGPIIFLAKKIMQETWNEKIDWDESVSMKIHHQWNQLYSQLGVISEIQIREDACIYVKSKDRKGKIKMALLC